MDENNGTILRNRCVDDRQIDVEEDDDKFDVGRSCIGGNNEVQLSCIEPTFPLKAANINPRAQETDAIVIACLIISTSNLVRF